MNCGDASEELPFLAPTLKEDMDGVLPRISTFQHHETFLTEGREHEKAISICDDLNDNTNSGFEGRIVRIRKKTNKDA